MNKLLKYSFLATAVILSSCATNGATSEGNHSFNELWSISALEKVVKDRSKDYYSSLIKEETAIKLSMCQGEYELGQVIISPKEDVSRFNAHIDGLISSQGKSISKKNIEVFGVDYMHVKEIYDTESNEQPGYFPDALIPIDALNNYGKAKIKAGENQAIYIKILTDINQAPGVYKGDLSVQLDNQEFIVPVEVEVYDLKVNEESHARACFENSWQFESGELEASQDMLTTYNNELYKYRLNGYLQVANQVNSHSDQDIEDYTLRAYQDMQNVKCNTVAIPYRVINHPDPAIGKAFDEATFKKYLYSFFMKSISKNYNMFKKSMVFFGGFVDEPDDFGLHDRAIYANQRYRAVINETADELDVYYQSHPMHDEIIESLRNVPNVMTCAWSEIFDGKIDSYCPKVNFYDTPELRAHYDDQKEKWWYTCVIPKIPYPTYHTEDILSSARSLSWMQAQYDVVGNLYWAANVYARTSGDIYFGIEDYYSGDAARAGNSNGDGYLFYPGKQFGLSYPLGCVRLEAIRDGLEEYELLYNLNEKLSEANIDKEAMYSFLTSYLYNGTRVSTSSIEMERARDDLIKISMANGNGSNFLISKNDADVYDNKVSLQFFAKNGTTIKVNDRVVQEGSTYGTGHLFNVEIPLDQEKNVAKIEVTYNDKTTVINHNLGGKRTKFSANELNNGFSKYNATISTSVVDYLDYGSVVKMDIGKVTNKKQSIKYIPTFLNGINNKVQTINIGIINPTSEDILFSVGNKFTSRTYDSWFTTNVTLKPGYNDVEFSVYNTKWDELGGLSYLMFNFGDTSSTYEEAKTLYLSSIVLSNKQGGNE